MNTEAVLQQISDQHDGELFIEDGKVSSGMGSFFHYLQYYLRIPHNNATIHIFYDNGISATVNFNIEIDNLFNVSEFQLETISHFTKLILFKKYNWKVTCKDLYLNREIEKLLQKHTLDQLILNTGFEPNMKGLLTKTAYKIHTVYSLTFEPNVTSMYPIVEFHKELIDILKERYKRF
ncbi:hypothetical protein [uncultured Kordia sp.]|uniref:hypothetical protein n=1 Tax=uncultured Kordia sp. TaxID=507699 RepID=UPI002637DE4D|nr:hypothetical protein [uncultured Kordia sp.]